MRIQIGCFILCLPLAASTNGGTIGNDVVKMRIISEPVSLTHAVPASVQENEEDDEDPTSELNKDRVPPSPFSGPEHLRDLSGRCFVLQKGNFEYKLCPFHNVTQRETSQTFGRKRFSGIIGIWYEWMIEDAGFVGWRMLNGDLCGSIPRSTTVDFACDRTTYAISDVSEPEQCHYRLTFKLPQACYPDSLLVYPLLSDKFQHAWNFLEGQMIHGELTEKGFDKRFRQLMVNAGFWQLLEVPVTASTMTSSASSLETTTLNSRDRSSLGDSMAGNVFKHLQQCQQAYNDLREELNGANGTRPQPPQLAA